MSDKNETELSNTLEDEHNFAAMRAGGSGGGTDRARPDVFASKDPHDLEDWPTILCFEVKGWNDRTGYASKEEIRALQSFSTRAGGRAVLAVSPDFRVYDRWHFFYPHTLRTTENSYVVDEDALPGLTLEELIADG
jgi:Holliday junction resolvase